MGFVEEQKQRERALRERETPFGLFTIREKTRWWNAIELGNAFRHLSWRSGLSLWDIGASDGRMLAYVRAHDTRARLVGTDLAVNPLKAVQRLAIEAHLVAADAARGVFKSDIFDRAVALQVIQQIPSHAERKKALRVIYQSLKAGGIFVLTVLSRSSWRDMVANGKEGPLLSSPELYVYLYDPQELSRDLQEVGFRVDCVKSVNNMPVRLLRRLGPVGVGLDFLISDWFKKFSSTKGRYTLVVCRKE